MANARIPSPTVSTDSMSATDLAKIAEACSLTASQIEDVYNCTPLQITCMAESSIRTGASVYQFVLSIAPSVDLDQLCDALQRVAWLNSTLRTRIVDCPLGLVQVVARQPHCTVRLSGDVGRHIKNEKEWSPNLGEPLFRSAIVSRRLVLTMHHAIMDNMSRYLLLVDMMRVYHGHEPITRAPFKDFVYHCPSIDEASARSFWTCRFKGVPAVYPYVESSYTPLASKHLIRMMESSRINADVSPTHIPSFLEAAWSLVLGAYAGSNNVAYGLAVSGRAMASGGIETTMGPTVAVVPVQARLQPSMKVRDMLKERATALRQLQTHPALQYGTSKIAQVSEAARIASGFQALLNMVPPMPMPELETCGQGVTCDDTEEPASAFAICLSCIFTNQGVIVKARFDPSVLCEAELRRFLDQYEHTVRTLMEADAQTKIASLQLLSSNHLSEILRWNSRLPAARNTCLHDDFTAQAARWSSNTAVEAIDGRISYSDLAMLSDQLAVELCRRGVTVKSAVALVFTKSMWAIVAMLAVLKAGGVCVPIDGAQPDARKKLLISSVKAGVILTSLSDFACPAGLVADVVVISPAFMADLVGPNDAIADVQKASPEDTAFILFTSGSTGAPKGVMLEHRCLVSALSSMSRRLNWRPGLRMLQFAAFVWDISIGEAFGALVTGGCLCMPSDEARLSGLAGFIQSEKVQCAWLTPTVLRTISPDEVDCLEMIISGGEPVSPTASRTWGKALRFVNAWGPCEASIASAAAELTPASPYPQTIGMPLNCAIWIINPDDKDELVPIGAVGELLVEGPGVARGYANDAIRTAAAFISPPRWAAHRASASSRFYRTGDLGRYNSDGSINFLGRKDSQVKIRGQRFELGELEGVLSGHGQVRHIFTEPKIYKGRTELVAVVSLHDPQLPTGSVLQELCPPHDRFAADHLRNLRAFASSKLPPYMVPTVWMAVEQMPQTASAKLARTEISDWLKTKDLSCAKAALCAPMAITLTPPVTTVEKEVQSIWASILEIPKDTIGRESCFVQLGGDSMLAMRAASRCQRKGIAINTALLLQNQPLAILAQELYSKPLQSDGVLPSSLEKPGNGDFGALEDRLHELDLENHGVSESDVESICPATDAQAMMLAIGQPGSKKYTGCQPCFTLQLTPALGTAKLQEACRAVLKHHPILRAVFVQKGPALHQVVLKKLHPKAVIVKTQRQQATPAVFERGASLARFCLFSDGQNCDSLNLEIHHALYDAVYLSLIFQDVSAAYLGNPMSDGPHFHSWLSHVGSLDGTAPRQFWIAALRGSSISRLAPPRLMPTRHYLLPDYMQIRTPMEKLHTSAGTPCSVIKAIWALVLSTALGVNDVLFGEVSSNRYLMMPGVEKVRGPCVNFLPVRARLDQEMTLAMLITHMHDSEAASLPHHHLGHRSIVKDCTSWPRWSSFGSMLVFQNHRSWGTSVRVGHADGTLSIAANAAESSDLLIVATPDPKDLLLELYFDNDTIPAGQMDWISRSTATLLQAIPSSLERTLGYLGRLVREAVGSYVMSPAPLAVTDPPSQHYDGPSPSMEAKDVVWNAWKELELLTVDQTEAYPMFSGNADLVTTLLLSEQYCSYGYKVSTEDIIRNPSRLAQARLIDITIRKRGACSTK
ncbi:Amino acid adenylation [Metarhizium guizhouense ARSEF 977]|uniref:Amino acid adenylation n=1 Tax=Metarhizium guizhouense (strain ARSEF 977) TaxID=1276136 RepID=A0A0B4H8A6_METGA|nr:Amino acid adenylation [Metarhizium guizhouense ARSEF 977]